jgi:glycosyltransferase involved in cell wall biosynthesis
MKILDVSVLTSDSECLPMSIIESMASSVPVVASNVGSIPDLVIDDINGYMVRPGDADGFAEAIMKIISNQEEAKRMGMAGYQMAKNNFSTDALKSNYERLFIELMNDKTIK